MSGQAAGRSRCEWSFVWFALAWVAAGLILLSPSSRAQQRREREPNSAYTARRAKLAAEVDAPIVLWGYTGREESSQAYIFAQEENFYYLTGHNEEGAAIIILPASKVAAGDRTSAGVTAADNATLLLPAKDPAKEKWNGFRMSPSDPGIEARTGFSTVKPFGELRATVERLAKTYGHFYTILPFDSELGGYPHEKEVVDWLQLAAPQAKLKDIRQQIWAMRPVKSAGEIAFLKQAIELSLDAHLEAMKMLHPGIYEYQVGAKMVEVHAMGGSEAEGYAPIVGAGPNSTVLHYDKLSRKIEDGDIVVLDVGAQYSGYSADITRTLPANGKFTPRQREIYEIVLGAQNAAMAALKPGMDLCRKGDKSVYRISYEYIDSHGKDKHGKSLGQYYIHGLGHHIGLNVHDPGDSCKPLESGNVVTMEPGIYIPEENLGVRIEDDVLITEGGSKLLSERLPRNADEIEKIMAEGAKQRAKSANKAGRLTGPNAGRYTGAPRWKRICLSVPRVIPRAAIRTSTGRLLEFPNVAYEQGADDSGAPESQTTMSSVKATQLRPGMVIQHEGQLYTVFSTDHRTPGNKRGSMQTRLKNLRTGTMIDYRFRAEEFVDRAILDSVEFEYLYNEGDDFHFMNTETYEQMHLTRDLLGETVYYLIPNTVVKVEFFEDKAIGVDLPDTMELKVVQTEPTLQKATASAVGKPATLETGLVVTVPPFVNEGDRIKVDTSEARYVQRVE